MLTRFVIAALGCLLVACGGGESSLPPLKAPTSFPPKGELREIAERPVPQLEAPEVAPVESWDFGGMDPQAEEKGASPEVASPPAEGDEATGEAPEDPEAAHRSVVAASAGKARFSPELDCVAEEVARFVVQHSGPPSDRILGFIAGRCGAIQAGLSTAAFTAKGGGSDEDLLEVMKPRLGEKLEAFFGARGVSGSGFHREGDMAVLAVVHAEPTAEMRLFPVEDGRTRIEGTISIPAAGVAAFINRGSHGVAPCKRESARLPAFAFVCELDPGDDQAFIEVLARVPKRLLMRFLGRALVHREGAKAITIPPLAAYPDDLLSGINAARSAAGLSSVSEEPAQSATNAAVAPHFFAAIRQGDDSLIERISLGILAGWDVSMTIHDANFYGELAVRRPDAGRWLAETLERPRGRIVLLDPDIDRVAIGVAKNDPLPGFGALVSTYEAFEPGDHGQELARAKAVLDAARKAAGQPPAELMASELLDEAVERIAEGDPVEEVLQDAAEAAARQIPAGVAAAYAASIRLEQIKFPAALVDMPGARVAMKVVHHRVPPGKWGFYLVLMLVTQDPSTPRNAGTAAPRAL